MTEKIYEVIYGALFILYFLIVVPLSGVALLCVSDGAIIHVLIIIVIAALHMNIAAIFFNDDSKVLAVTFLISFMPCLIYLNWDDVIPLLFLLIY